MALVRRATQAIAELDMSKAQQEMPIVDAFMADDIVWHEIGRAEPLRRAEAAVIEGPRNSTITYDLHERHRERRPCDRARHRDPPPRGGKTLVYRTAEIFHIRDPGRARLERWAFSDDTEAITAFFA